MSNATDTFPPSHQELIKWAKAFPRSKASQAQKSMKKSRRVASMDDSSLTRKDSGYSTGDDSIKNRSLSEFSPPTLSASLLMNPLNFEVIDVGNTPLSSLRSCSEFNKPGSYHGIHRKNTTSNEQQPSFLSRMYEWTFSRKKTKVDTSKLKYDEQIYLVEQLRFRPSNDEIASSVFHTKASSSRRKNDMKFPSSSYYNQHDDDNDEMIDEYQKHAHKRSFLSESSFALDVVFGFGSNTSKSQPKEIELREFHRPAVATIPSRNSMRDLASIDELRVSEVSSLTDVFQVNHHPYASISSADVAEANGSLNISPPYSLSSQAHIASLTFYQVIASIKPVLKEHLSKLARYFSQHLLGEEDDFYYETIRMQPFASGAYLRGMLLAGFTNFFFTSYGLALWPIHQVDPANALSPNHRLLEQVLYVMLCLQFGANTCQLPFRLLIHYNCWESSRAVDIEASIDLIRQLVHSDYWIVNRGIGRIIDSLSACCLLIGEIYIWISPWNDPLRPLCVSICATILLSLFVRTLVAMIFTLSMHDPQILSDARRRGLSRLDLESLPTFVFTHNDEVNNCDCPICLCSFDMGEMLISLPCNHKHSFHAACIRQWLERQNSCPLCQRLV
jgi:hypothetical protein